MSSLSSTYKNLSTWPFLKNSYPAKFMTIAFLGIHIPLIAFCIFLIVGDLHFTKLNAILIVLLATLVATAITLYIFYSLLAPLHASKKALNDYITLKKTPDLPVTYTDEVGILMKEIQFTINTLNNLIEEKKDISALLSHDLRSPLYQFALFCRLIKGEMDNDMPNRQKVLEICTMAEKLSEEKIQQLNAFLEAFSQDDLHLYNSQLQKVPLEVIVNKALTNMDQAAKEKGITVQRDFNPGITVNVDEEGFTHVLQNLLTNAVKFSYNNTAVKIKATQSDAKTNIEVVDEGIGFDPTHASSLFMRYTPNRQMGTQGENTTGIGLYLTKKIVEQHNGRIEAFSAGKDKGSKFLIEIPA
ncbi:MAG: HAMP domain-containing histidine kinase [Filimonas sp.]|nr:HAMP domain-containing histidine kinase [Filimonas sp.]